MNNDKIRNIIEVTGIKNVDHTTLVHAYKFVAGKAYTGGCSTCFRRNAMKAVINYYNKL